MPQSLDVQTSGPAAAPSSGAGSQTPPNPNTDATPLGGVSAIKPNGNPGAPMGSANAAKPEGGMGGAPAAGGAGGMGGKPPMGGSPAGAQAPAISPEDLNRYKAIQQSLYPDLVKAVESISSDETFRMSDATDEQVQSIKNYLLDLGWDSTYLSNEILKSNNLSDIKKFFSLVIDYQDRSRKDDLKQFENFIKQKDIAVNQQSNNLKMQEKMNDQSSLQTQPKPLAVQEKLNQTKSSQYLRGTGMDIVVENGTIKTASPESPEIVGSLFKATKAAERSIESYKQASLLQAGAKALNEPIDAFDESVLRKEVEASVSALQSKLAEASSFLKGNDDPKVEDELSKFVEKGKGTVEKGKGLFAPKAEEKKESPFEKKDEAKPAEEKKDAPEGEKKDAPKPAEGKKDAPAGGKPSFGKKEEPKGEEKKEPADSVKKILADLRKDLFGKREAQTTLPYKDISKTNTMKNVNADTAKDAEKESAKALNGEDKTNKSKGLLGMNREKQNISPAQFQKAKAAAVSNAFAKSKLAMELASQQQFKGLLPNPLKVAMVKNMVEAGIDKTAAEAIAHNSMIDGYQASYEVVSKEAFANFVNKDYKDFVKTAEYTLNSGMVEADASSKA